VQQRSWTFRRGDEQLVLQRHQHDSGFTLAVIRDGSISNIPFHEESALNVFQNDMEELLVHTGWTLQECRPERRRKSDRRTFPRVTNDRRRWWTDPAGDESAVPVGGDRRTNRRRAAKK
jgi:hypothetical protein